MRNSSRQGARTNSGNLEGLHASQEKGVRGGFLKKEEEG
jgi:hypothetical protein